MGLKKCCSMPSSPDTRAELEAQEHMSSPDKKAELEAHDEDMLKYLTIDGLMPSVIEGSIKPQSGRYLVKLARRGFLHPEHDHLNATIKGDKKSVEFIALSYRWISAGEQYFLAGASGREPAQAVHRRLIECIHDLASPAESNAEKLNVEGVPA